ncbi:hypothetical protein LB941_08310 [Ligilactobacillus sp. WILCCON 0076]|uniref:Uncharacterized protein n=1 Tax=Ligilactobacillus ubinensis TaxID=2876789 RepID=A0A9X2FL75_9LACO|nr:hypothetical protein [Ligilactobacillus ubinensis]MCP0887335.1 hypothetical protein [Ligilactobacillus ubinensis]
MKILQNKKITIMALLAIILLGILGFAYYKHETKYDYEINQVLNYENKVAVPGQKKLTKQNTKIVIYDDLAENEHLISISFKYPNGNQANDWFTYYLLNNKSKFLQTFPDKVNTLKIIYKKRNW